MEIKQLHIKPHNSRILLSVVIRAVFFFLGYSFISHGTVYASGTSTCSIKNEFETHQLPNKANNPLFFISYNRHSALQGKNKISLKIFNKNPKNKANIRFGGRFGMPSAKKVIGLITQTNIVITFQPLLNYHKLSIS